LRVWKRSERAELVHKLVHRSDLWTRAEQYTDNGCLRMLGKRISWSRRGLLKITREASDGRKRHYWTVYISSWRWAKAVE
jgi:hypothetical protein